jgi:ComF family protein
VDAGFSRAPFSVKKGLRISKRGIRGCLAPFRDALFPSRCLICGAFHDPKVDGKKMEVEVLLTDGFIFQAPMGVVFESLLSSWMCPECLPGFVPIVSPLCPVCGMMFAGRQGTDHPCPECTGVSRMFHRARSVGIYGLKLMEAVHRFKYEGKTQLAGPLGMLLFIAFCRIWEEDPVDIVLPVPLHRRRLRGRGFNQAYLLVRDWPRYSRISGAPVFHYMISGNILERTRWGKPQIGLRRAERKANIEGAFAVKKPFSVSGKRILLVDDVHTTGATGEACAMVLTQAGASRVDVFTLARTL